MPYTNKLYLVDDEIHQNAYASDIDDQGTFSSTTNTINTANNYGYDKLGNLIRDNAEQIASIQWDVTGKIKSITRSTGSKKADLVYGYDASGTRLFKVVIPKQQNGSSTGTRMSQEHWDTTWYVKDASGNAMATYKTTHTRIYTAQPQNSTLKKQFFTEELYIYGSNRHGVLKASDLLSEKEYALSLGQYVVPDSTFPQVQEGEFETIGSTQTITVNYEQGEFTFARGAKQYELSNHLGNVLVTIQDRKWGIQTTSGNNANHYIPYIVTTTDYYAFGSSMVERSQSFGEIYKFGMNTQEKENELGDGVTSAEFWMYDGKLGRRWNLDPLDQVRLSNYSVNGNNPIINLDIKGDYFFGLIGSTKKQRDAARQMASAHNGEIKNITTNNIHVLWTNTITENNFSYRPGTAYILTEKIVNRKTSFLKNGDAITQRLLDGKWEDILYPDESKNLPSLFVGNGRENHPIFAGDKNETHQAQIQASNGEIDVTEYQKAYDKINDINCAIFMSCVGTQVTSSTSIVQGASFIESKLFPVTNSTATKGVGPIVGGGSKLEYLGNNIDRIQNIATKYNVNITVVGGRAKGTANAYSDWDYIITGGTSKTISSALFQLPKNPNAVKDGMLRPGSEILKGVTVDPRLPHIIFKPTY